MATRYRKRYEKYRLRGYTGAEARMLAKITSPPPYLANMRLERGKLYAQWQRSGKGIEAYRRMVRDFYDKKHALAEDGRPDPYALLRKYEDRYGDLNPDYRSPSYKKLKDYQASKRKLRRSLGEG